MSVERSKKPFELHISDTDMINRYSPRMVNIIAKRIVASTSEDTAEGAQLEEQSHALRAGMATKFAERLQTIHVSERVAFALEFEERLHNAWSVAVQEATNTILGGTLDRVSDSIFEKGYRRLLAVCTAEASMPPPEQVSESGDAATAEIVHRLLTENGNGREVPNQ